MLINKAQCKAINFLLHELIENGINFEFVDPINGDDRHLLRWVSGSNPLDSVSQVVESALKHMPCRVLLGSVNASTWNGSDAYYVGFKKELTDDE
ncbi:hypothetical protein CPT_Margaery258 [Citrobacter phage Margaery]|uniref:Uncharacterized protein n=2 Tax=Pseudotevenvirus margaery TaxID=2843955 RepID=A0A0M4RCC7_9CAUD|nr:hypothetical protein CPT_Margaery258 [Citrobacter phage Margaery]ALF01947.1 hypothetical protein CPT_Margaery258 [Citrobacter phage Margaery]AYJ73118.1 hypothetical protein CPT_Maroon_255 [Citrobacter phage Maroon]